MTEHIVPPRVYILVFASLMILTLVTTEAAYLNLGAFNVVVALAIAGSKATLVVLFFMHVRYSKRIIWLVVFAGVLWLALLLGLTLTDVFSRGWLPPVEGWEPSL